MVPIELIDAARSGGAAEIERLLEAAWPDAYRLARAILAHDQGADDVAQEACVNTYRSIGTLRSSDAFRTWFYRIVLREALKAKKHLATSMPLSGDAVYYDDPAAAIDLWRALATLPEHLRAVVVLTYFEDLSSREVGQILRIPDATVRFRLMTAKRRLLPLLRENAPSDSSKGELYAL